jgi:diaminopimelate decarboxylase
LTIDRDKLADVLGAVAERAGTPCYVYMLDAIRDRIESIRRAFEGRFAISYAVKANPNRGLLRAIRPWVDILDVSSDGELLTAIESGYEPKLLSFSGPGKTLSELQTSIRQRCGMHIAESVDELEQLSACCIAEGRRMDVLIRISPDKVPKGFGLNMSGRPSQFGIDEEHVDEALTRLKQLPNLSFAGFHIYAGTQCLDGDSIAENIEGCARLFSNFSKKHGLEPKKLTFGAGMGIPYHAGDEKIDLNRVATLVNPVIDQLLAEPRCSNAKCFLELGRYLVGEAGYFLTRIVRIKESRGKLIGVCDGGMNHHLAACGHFGTIIHRNYIIESLASPEDCRAIREYDLFGPLCTTIDTVARNVQLPELRAGDVLAIGSSGAYGLTASPLYFISRSFPKEMLVSLGDGDLQISDATQLGVTSSEDDCVIRA